MLKILDNKIMQVYVVYTNWSLKLENLFFFVRYLDIFLPDYHKKKVMFFEQIYVCICVYIYMYVYLCGRLKGKSAEWKDWQKEQINNQKTIFFYY